MAAIIGECQSISRIWTRVIQLPECEENAIKIKIDNWISLSIEQCILDSNAGKQLS
jgi:hypothetical protein